MEINKIKINSYGKLKNKEIDLKNNLNIIYGENESGKSTLLKFILNIFYGASRNKKGKEISDFEKYKPWDSQEYSGKLVYELDNQNKYEIYREFNKKNPTIFNEKGEEISKQFNIDKNKGSEFFFEQTQISEEMLLATSIAMQQEIKIEKNSQNILIQKISNLVETGEDNISYKKAIEKINKMQLEKVGTDRSREKPINIIQKKIEEDEQKIQELKKYENEQYEIEEEKDNLKNDLEKDEIKNNLLKEIKIIKEKNNIENEKIKIKEKILEENNNKITNIKNNLEKINNKYSEEKNNLDSSEFNCEKKKLNKKLILFFILLILINIFWILCIPNFIKNKIIKYIFLLTVPAYLIFSILIKNKLNKKIKILKNNEKQNFEKIELEKNNLENQLKLYENNFEQIKNEINKINSENNINDNLEKNKLINKYEKNIEKYEIEEIFENKNINEKIYLLEEKINNYKIEINKLELRKKYVETEIEKLVSLEEELFSYKEQYENLRKTNDSIELVKKLLSSAYEKMKNNVSPIFTEQLSKNISKITKEKYCKLYFNDEQGLIVELENGNYVPAERLSTGTIDQLYLSLRLAMLDQVSNEKVPIILDEAFAYYDDNRLKNILNYLATEFEDRQIIILTCTNREKRILEELNIPFNNVVL